MRLRPEHREWSRPTHPAVRKAKVYTEDQIEAFCQAYLDYPTEENRHAAIMSFASCIRHITGRWLGTYSRSWPFEDDIVQVGFETIINSVDSMESSEGVMKTFTNRVLAAQTRFLNKNRTTTAPSASVQSENYSNDESGIPDDEEFDVDYHDRQDPCNEMSQIEFVDAMRALAKDDLDRELIHPRFWAKPVKYIAAELGVRRETVSRRRARLIEALKEEMRNA